MKQISIFVQVVIVLIAIVVLVILILFPLREGRAVNLDLFRIYTDPFILYGYLTSIVFFVGLYKMFKLFGFIRQNKLYTVNSFKSLKTIKYCAIIISILIVSGGFYVKLFHSKDDDPAGFLAVCALTTLLSITVAIFAAKYEKRIKNSF